MEARVVLSRNAEKADHNGVSCFNVREPARKRFRGEKRRGEVERRSFEDES
jgi:hypothetical protein